MSPKFKILSIDGGGIRGIIPCIILKYIEKENDLPISNMFNLVAGTSTGGIIALGLTKSDGTKKNAFSAEDMLRLYVDNGKAIFSDRPKDILSWISGKLFDKSYGSDNMEDLLNTYFGNSLLKESLINVLITTYEIEKGRPFYFSSRLAKKDEKEDFPLKTIARSTSAAPTYFQPSIVSYDKGNDLAFVDGGVFANNPAILAYSEAKELWKARIKQHAPPPGSTDTKGFEPVVSPDDNDFPFYMLSVGTGFTTNTIKASEIKDYRNKDWFEPLLTNVFMRSVAESTDFTMQHLLPPYLNGTPRYQRLNFKIPEKYSEMDNASDENIDKLAELGENFVKTNKELLNQICEIIA